MKNGMIPINDGWWSEEEFPAKKDKNGSANETCGAVFPSLGIQADPVDVRDRLVPTGGTVLDVPPSQPDEIR